MMAGEFVFTGVPLLFIFHATAKCTMHVKGKEDYKTSYLLNQLL
jgi:hypothetical protein